MPRHQLSAQLHRPTATMADLHHVGALSVDLDPVEVGHVLAGPRATTSSEGVSRA